MANNKFGPMNIQLFADPGDDLSLEELLKDDNAGGTPPPTVPATPPVTEPIDQTKAFSERLKKEAEKIRNEERLTLAKSEGFDTYEAYLKRKETKLAEDKGLDPNAFAEVFDKLYEERAKNDPRFAKLAEYESSQAEAWGKAQAEELSKLIGKPLTIADIGQDVMNAVKPGGSLVDAYMAVHGKKLLQELRTASAAAQSKGTTAHLFSPTSSQVDSKLRALSPEEMKAAEAFAQFAPGITEKDLQELKTSK